MANAEPPDIKTPEDRATDLVDNTLIPSIKALRTARNAEQCKRYLVPIDVWGEDIARDLHEIKRVTQRKLLTRLRAAAESMGPPEGVELPDEVIRSIQGFKSILLVRIGFVEREG